MIGKADTVARLAAGIGGVTVGRVVGGVAVGRVGVGVAAGRVGGGVASRHGCRPGAWAIAWASAAAVPGPWAWADA